MICKLNDLPLNENLTETEIERSYK